MLRRSILAAAVSVLCLLTAGAVTAQIKTAAKIQDTSIPAGSKVYIAPMAHGFDTYLAAGIIKKKVPVVIVTQEDKADFVISGVSHSKKASWVKMLVAGSDAPSETASMQVVNRKTDVVVFAYSWRNSEAVLGLQSAAEACAKRLKKKIEKNK